MPQNGQNFTEKYLVISQQEIAETAYTPIFSDTYLNLQPGANQ